MNDTQSDTQYSISDAKNDTHENEVGGQEIPKVDRKGGQKIQNDTQETKNDTQG